MFNNSDRYEFEEAWFWAIIIILVSPILTICLVHLIAEQSFGGMISWIGSQFKTALIEYTGLLILEVFIFTILRLLSVSVFLPGLALLALTLVSHYKTIINGTPLLYSDFTLIKQFSEIAEFAMPQLSVSIYTVLAIVIFLGMVGGLIYLDLHLGKLKRVRLVSFMIVIAMIIGYLYNPEIINIELPKEEGVMTQEDYATKYGPIMGLYYTYASTKDMEAVYRIYRNKNANTDGKEYDYQAAFEAEGKELPTIIFIMSESFFDATKLPNVTYSKDPIPNFHRLASEHTSGGFISNTYGGGTGYVEMEVMTGLCGNMLKSPETMTSILPNSRYSKIPAITDVFKIYGYNTTFLHTYNSRLYNRESIYQQFGFDNILFDRDFPEGAEKLGDYTTDMELSKEIISMYEKSVEPMFLLGVSVENHQPYNKDKYVDKKVTVSSDLLSEEGKWSLEAYVNGLNSADTALGYLVDYFEKIDKPVILVFWGDHLPNLSCNGDESVFSQLGYTSTAKTTDWSPEEMKKMLTTDYLIWTNYQGSVYPDKTESSLFLGVSVLERLGLGLTDYYYWLSKEIKPYMLMYRPRLFIDSSEVASSEIPEDKKAIVEDYSLKEYDIVYGKNKIFEVSR